MSVKVVYVDNCCNVCTVVKSAFPGCLVKLDAFHWLKRWNLLLFDLKSPLAGVFRGLMHKALFNVDQHEYDRAKAVLQQRKQREPTSKEILRFANSVIPEPTALRANVEAVYNYCVAKDSQTEASLSTRQQGDDSPEPRRFFKPSNSKLVSHRRSAVFLSVCPLSNRFIFLFLCLCLFS